MDDKAGSAFEEVPVDVLALWLDRPADEVARLRQLLAEDERVRADRFHFTRDRARFVVGRGHLRLLLGERVGLPPASIRFGTGPHGQPFLEDGSREGVRFSVSHSGGLALIALTQGQPIGVDVERIRENADLAGLAERFFAAEERDALYAQEAGDRRAWFFQQWTAKEAVLKAVGLGLTGGLASIVVRADGAGLAVIRSRLAAVEPRAWTLAPLAVPDGYVATLAVRGVRARAACRWLPSNLVPDVSAHS